jgi:pimeloyl-ACP methyl ester carboxylesterase
MSRPRRITVSANGIDFHALELGEGPLVLCLHGFPDTADNWLYQFGPLAEAGYCVVAPYMRGYGPTGAAPGGYYQTAALGRDGVALIEALGAEDAVVFGHDWGALAAYATALAAPERVHRLVAAAVPYGPQVAGAFLTDYAQQKRSWYIFFFQSPLADMAVAHDDLRFIRNLWKDWSPGYEAPEEVIGAVIETLSQPGVLEAAIGYYRCMFDPARQDPALAAEQLRQGVEPITVPTLYLHGADDGCMGAYLGQGMEAMFPAGLTTRIVENAGHFLQLEQPGIVNRAVLDFLTA